MSPTFDVLVKMITRLENHQSIFTNITRRIFCHGLSHFFSWIQITRNEQLGFFGLFDFVQVNQSGQMSFEMMHSFELHLTQFASIWSNSRVNPLVISQILLGGKVFSANITFESFGRMFQLMLVQNIPLFE